ncbi:hypothetical protein GOODEAATRI_033273, partial [Goodea atripinnis]
GCLSQHWTFRSRKTQCLSHSSRNHSLESLSPHSPFTHYEEKIQNMRCASVIVQVSCAAGTFELYVCCHFASPDM